MLSRRVPVLRSLGLCAVLMLGLSYPLAADEPASIRQLGHELHAIEKMVKNAEIKLKNGISGGARGAVDGGESAPFRSPAQSCCSANIRNIHERAQAAGALIEQLTVRYEKESDRAAVDLLTQVRENLIAVQQGTVAFERAGSTVRAFEALAGLIRPIIRIRTATQGLATCCSGQPATLEPVETDPVKTKKKKSREKA